MTPASGAPPAPRIADGISRDTVRDNQRGGIIFRLISLLFLVLIVAALYVVRYPLLRAAGEFWVVEDPPQAADAIVILGDDNFYADRAERAAELYRAGWAPRIVASGRYLRPYLSVAELMQRDLTLRGIPPAAIVPFPQRAENTREEAAELAKLFSQQGWHRILLVTSNYHTRRARYICERLFPAGTQLFIQAARDTVYDPGAWWKTRIGVRTFAKESLGMLVAIWELRDAHAAAALLLPAEVSADWAY
jgi:uncharacterized SAM-binding protein YcdF (DUF218 family)